MLLTVLSASGDLAHANDRQAQHPEAIAEDMESFGVAIACACTRTPLSVIRGISNVAGDRNHVGWRVDDALIAASEVLREQP